MRTIIAAAAIIVGMGTAAQAANVGSAPTFGGPTQAVAVCYYSVLGPQTVTFSSSVVLGEPGTPLAEASEFCGGAIAPGNRCRTVTGSIVGFNGALWCRAVVDTKAGLRGRLEIRNSSGEILTSQDIN